MWAIPIENPAKSTGSTAVIPWNEIILASHRFYQPYIFRFTVPLDSPAELSNSQVPLIAKFLASISSPLASRVPSRSRRPGFRTTALSAEENLVAGAGTTAPALTANNCGK
jgi:hypothetical protein